MQLSTEHSMEFGFLNNNDAANVTDGYNTDRWGNTSVEQPPNDVEQANFNQFLVPNESNFVFSPNKAIFTNACHI